MSHNLWIILNIFYAITGTVFLLNLFIKTKFKWKLNIVTSFVFLGLNYFACIVIFLSQSITYTAHVIFFFVESLLVILFTYITITDMRIKKHLKMHAIGNIVLLIIVTIFVVVVFINKEFL